MQMVPGSAVTFQDVCFQTVTGVNSASSESMSVHASLGDEMNNLIVKSICQ